VTKSGGVSRRELLAGIGIAGAAIGSSAVGHSTASAFLADAEQFAGNVLTAGAVDIGIHYETFYTDSEDNTTSSTEDTVDGDSTGGLEIQEIKPGDEGGIKFYPEVLEDPAYLWLGGGVTMSAENGQPDPEGEPIDGQDPSPLDRPGGELEDAMEARLVYARDDSEDVVIDDGPFTEVLGTLRHGVPLSADQTVTDPGEQVCFDGSGEQCIEFEWWVPESPGGNSNNIVTDELEFEFVFHAQQCRQNDGTANPCPSGLDLVAFCVDESDEISESNVSFSVVERNAVGEPIAIDWDWSSDTALQTVVLYDADVFENFYVDADSGTATVGAGDERFHYEPEDSPALENGQSPDDPCPDGETGIWYNYDGGEFTLDS
jgi:hypothetical protein